MISYCAVLQLNQNFCQCRFQIDWWLSLKFLDLLTKFAKSTSFFTFNPTSNSKLIFKSRQIFDRVMAPKIAMGYSKCSSNRQLKAVVKKIRRKAAYKQRLRKIIKKSSGQKILPRMWYFLCLLYIDLIHGNILRVVG